MKEEIWRDVVGYEGLYQVSNIGRVVRTENKRLLKLDDTKGYFYVGLYKRGKQKRFCVHKLVADAFLDNKLGQIRVTHLDGNTLNNNVENLAFEGLVCGVGINDVPRFKNKAHKIWLYMIQRCYDKKKRTYKFYKDCFVCNEWLRFSNFLKWFNDKNNGYRNGFHLDKDLLTKDSRVYSPDTCCFIPPEINKALIFKRNKKDGLPIGVSFLKDRNCYAGMKHDSSYKRFKTVEEAYSFYIEDKTRHIKELADKYRDVITERVYNVLSNYKIE